MMFDKEIEAIAKCTEQIKDLEEDAKVRVVKYLIERFGIGFSKSPTFERSVNADMPVKQLKESQPGEVVEFVDEESDNDYPTLKDLMIKDYPKTEAEWVLCYAFYSSKSGTDTFKREDISDRYKENNRFSESSKANLGNNINACVKKDWFKSVNDSDFVMKPEGINYSKQVVSGNSISKERKPNKRKNSKIEE